MKKINKNEAVPFFTIKGQVIHGKKRGKKMGFPTINVPLDQEISEGIYVSQTTIDSIVYNSLTFVGASRTFGETTIQSETYLFHFDKKIYAKHVMIVLLEKIRDNVIFESEEKLIEQMEEDKKHAEKYFSQSLVRKNFPKII